MRRYTHILTAYSEAEVWNKCPGVYFELAQMLLGRSEGAQGSSVGGIEFLPKSTEIFRFVVYNREHPAQEKQVDRL
jgi:hypothetical protein